MFSILYFFSRPCGRFIVASILPPSLLVVPKFLVCLGLRENQQSFSNQVPAREAQCNCQVGTSALGWNWRCVPLCHQMLTQYGKSCLFLCYEILKIGSVSALSNSHTKVSPCMPSSPPSPRGFDSLLVPIHCERLLCLAVCVVLVRPTLVMQEFSPQACRLCHLHMKFQPKT